MQLFSGIVFGVLLVSVSACTHLPVGNTDTAPKVKSGSYLSGKNQQQVERIMGDPVVQRIEEPNQLWAYYDKGCSTLVYFNAQGVCQHAEMRGTCERRLVMKFP